MCVLTELYKLPGMSAQHTAGDADYAIYMRVRHIAQTKPVVVVVEYTDVLVLLEYHYTPASHHTIYMYMQTGKRLIDISRIQKTLDVELSRTLLFIHALSVCDATSKPYVIGKTSAMSKYRSLTEYSKVFLKPNQQRADVEEAGNHALAILCGGTSGSDLNFERASRFSGKFVSNSGRFHSQRVYLQVQTWIGNAMNATEWGWTLNGSTLKPYRMEQGAAPSSLWK